MKTAKQKSKSCFVIMPISDMEGYDAGHFTTVYKHLLKPACEEAGYIVRRADEVKQSNYIIIDILKKIIDADIVVCDLSGHNPNVLYELGIRHAFNKPVLLLKDNRTEKVFDIQGLRYTQYDYSLRADLVKAEIIKIAEAMKETAHANPTDVNSVIQLVGINAAKITNPTELSYEATLLYHSLQDISNRLTSVEDALDPTSAPHFTGLERLVTTNGKVFTVGYSLWRGSTLLGGISAAYLNGVVYEDSKKVEDFINIDELRDGNYTVTPPEPAEVFE